MRQKNERANKRTNEWTEKTNKKWGERTEDKHTKKEFYYNNKNIQKTKAEKTPQAQNNKKANKIELESA